MADLKDILAKRGVAPANEASAAAGQRTWLDSFFRSSVEAIPELVGFDASRETLKWRAEHPISGIISQFASVAVPYVGWEAGAAKLPVLGKVLSRVASAEKMAAAPIRTSVLKEMVKWAPFETGRVATAAVIGEPHNLGEVATSALIDMGFAAGVGTVVGAWRATRVPPSEIDNDLAKLSKLIPGLNPAESKQLQLRQLEKAAAERGATLGAKADTDPVMSSVKSAIARLNREIRIEFPKAPRGVSQENARYVYNMIGKDGLEHAQQLNRMFKVSGAKMSAHITRLRWNHSEYGSDFALPGAWENFILPFGLKASDVPYMQYPRAVMFKSENAAKSTEAMFSRTMENVGDGWYIAREAPHGVSSGLYVMARKMPGAVKQEDRWVIFKTDTPSHFGGSRTKWADMVSKRTEWENTYLARKDIEWARKNLQVYGAIEDFIELMPYQEMRAIPKGGSQKVYESLVKKLGLTAEAQIVGDTGARLKAFAKEYAAPTLFQFSSNPLARWLYGVARNAFDVAQTQATLMMYGEVKTRGAGSLLKDVFGKPQAVGNIKGALDPLTEKDLADVHHAWRNQLSPEKARASRPEMSEEAFKFLKELDKWDTHQMRQMQQTQQFVGLDEFTPSPFHYMIARTWSGAYRQRIVDEGDQLIYVAAGNRAQAGARAQAVLKQAQEQGKNWRLLDPEPLLSDRWTDLEVLKKLKVSSPGHRLALEMEAKLPPLRPKTGGRFKAVGGFIGDEAPWTKDELEAIIKDHVFARQRYIAEISVNHRIGMEMFNLGKEDPSLYKQLMERVQDLVGRPGPLAKFQNQLVDRVLAPVMGPNSATKIVSVANNVMMNLQLGMGNLAHPILNAMTFITTVLPHAAYTLTADPAMLQRYYSMFAVSGTKGPVGDVGVLEPLKLMYRGFKELRKPDEALSEAFRKAQLDGVTDPRLVEDYLGEQSVKLNRFREVLTGEEPFVNYLRTLSEYLPAQSEKLARAHGFVVGHIIGRDFFKLQDQVLYQFAKEFTNNTMYLYSVADRARMITGPAGSLFGMFKNWQMHYIGQMLSYTGEAFMRGNFAPLLWMTGGTAALGGVGALPLYSIADSMSKVLTDESLMLNIYQMMGFAGGDDPDETTLADGLFYGIPGFMGLSLQGTATAPGQDFAKDASMFFSFVHWDRMKYMGKTMGAAWDHWQATGRSPVESPHFRDLLVRAIGPKSIFRAMQVVSDEGMRSLSTGYPIMSNMDIHNKVLYSLSLTPVEVDKTYASMDELWRQQQLRLERTRALGQAWMEAKKNKDSMGMYNVLVQGQAQGLDHGSILRSARARQAKSEEAVIERQFKPQPVRPYKEAGLVE